MAQRVTVWITGDQCSLRNSALAGCDPASTAVLMIESVARSSEIAYHKRKLVLIYATMRAFAARLRTDGWRVDYHAERPDFEGPLREHLAAFAPHRVRMMQQSEYGVTERMQALVAAYGLSCDVTEHCNFISTQAEFEALFSGGKARITMESFYRFMRRKTGLLMDGDRPAGGAWNYDARNRKPPKPGMTFPEPWIPRVSESTRDVIAMVERHFAGHPGEMGSWDLAVTREDALRAARDFIENRLDGFGPYEDAMLAGQPVMFHSRLSPMINVGLLHPLELAEMAEAAYRSGSARIESVEGFIRQLIGWREFMWRVYWRMMPEYRTRNALGANLPLPAFYRTGETQMRCLRETLAHVRATGHTHHILRLMVLGNFGLIAGVQPASLNDWFWANFVDGYDWVMVPNVIGMSLHADGGFVGTKPYAASANYINSMSDYCSGCIYRPKKVVEDDACPFNALYWDFLAANETRFAANPRMKLPLQNWLRRPADWQAAVRSRAAALRERLRRGETL